METMNRDSQNSSGTNYPVKKAKTVFVILGYLCCLLGGINGIESINLFLNYRCGLIYRIIVDIGVLLAVGGLNWGLSYAFGKTYSDEGVKYYKYSKITRIHGVLMVDLLLLSGLRQAWRLWG